MRRSGVEQVVVITSIRLQSALFALRGTECGIQRMVDVLFVIPLPSKGIILIRDYYCHCLFTHVFWLQTSECSFLYIHYAYPYAFRKLLCGRAAVWLKPINSPSVESMHANVHLDIPIAAVNRHILRTQRKTNNVYTNELKWFMIMKWLKIKILFIYGREENMKRTK